MHVLAYVQSKRITIWKNLVHGSGLEAFVYGSKDRQIFPTLKRGDVLWVIASSKSQNPTLVARISVDSCGDLTCRDVQDNPNALVLLRDKHHRFPTVVTGGRGSSFYGFNDAGDALMKLVFRTSTGHRIHFGDQSDKWENKFGQYLQRPIQIEDSLDANALEILAGRCERNCIFISWKHKDHPRGRFPHQVAYALVEYGFSVWFDLLALPASKYLKKICRDPKALSHLLEYGYRQSRCILALHSKSYGEITTGSDRNWTLEEWEGTLETDRNEDRIRVMVSSNSNLPSWCGVAHLIHTNSPTEIASYLKGIVRQSL
jgi:hypothetical protein